MRLPEVSRRYSQPYSLYGWIEIAAARLRSTPHRLHVYQLHATYLDFRLVTALICFLLPQHFLIAMLHFFRIVLITTVSWDSLDTEPAFFQLNTHTVSWHRPAAALCLRAHVASASRRRPPPPPPQTLHTQGMYQPSGHRSHCNSHTTQTGE
jgi:hypothetical protein